MWRFVDQFYWNKTWQIIIIFGEILRRLKMNFRVQNSASRKRLTETQFEPFSIPPEKVTGQIQLN